MKRVILESIYTSGIFPIGNNSELLQHDDWGIKYVQEKSSYDLESWKALFSTVQQEALAFLRSEKKGIFARFWEENGQRFFVVAIPDREKKGAFRSNLLLVAFEVCEAQRELDILQNLTFSGNPLPEGLSSLKENPSLEIGWQENPWQGISLSLKLGKPPIASSDFTWSRGKENFLGQKKVKASLFLTLLAFIGVSIFSLLPKSTLPPLPDGLTTQAVLMGENLREQGDRLDSVQQENFELHANFNSLQQKTEKVKKELQLRNSLARDVGGWESLQVLIEQIQEIGILPENLANKVQEARQIKQSSQQLKTELNSLIYYLKKAQLSRHEQRQNANGDWLEVTIVISSQLKDFEERLQQHIEKLP